MVGLGEKVRTSRLLPPGKFMEYLYEDAQTLFDVMYRGARVSNNGRCMAWREPGAKEYSYIHYNQVCDKRFSTFWIFLRSLWTWNVTFAALN